MNKFRNGLIVLFIAIFSISLAACNNSSHKAEQKDTSNQEITSSKTNSINADYVFTNAKVYTVNPKQEWAQALAVTGNKISYVGDDTGVKEYIGPDTKIVDLEGKMMLPGFVSGHDHIIASNWIADGVSLHGAENKQEVLDRVAKYAKENPDEKFIKGSGWNTAMFGSGYPIAADLDPIVSDRPVFLIDVTGHEGWLNSLAMERGNITKDTPDILPGTTYWIRDDSGTPTGVGLEFQWTGTFVDQGAWNPEVQITNSVNKLHKIAAENGMTAFLSPGAGTPNIANDKRAFQDFESILGILNDMDAKDELILRTVLLPWYKSPDADPVKTSEKTAILKEKYNSDMVKTIGVKIHPESGWFSRGAPMIENYKGTDKKGGFGVSPERSKELVLEANKRGLDVVVHVEGDASARAAIDAFEASIKAGHTEVRNTLHHAVILHPDDYQRIIDLGITVNATPQFSTSWSNHKTLGYEILGKDLMDKEFGRYSDLAQEGVRVSISADYPSTPADMMGPLYQIQVAMTLTDPSDPNAEPFPSTRKPMTLEQSIEGVTINGAWILRLEDKVGTVEVGKLADLVVLEKNLFDVKPGDIADVKVLLTMMDGNVTYKNSSFNF